VETVALTTQEYNVHLTQRVWDEVWHQGKFEVMKELFTPDFVRHDPNGQELHGREETEQFIRKTRDTFPDLHYTVEDALATQDKVVIRYYFEGTHKGDALGFPATGKQVRYSGILIQRVANGKIAEQWTEADLLSLFQQLGVIPKLK
jgi:steroid delta-isomerase-like uncharacterized protein